MNHQANTVDNTVPHPDKLKIKRTQPQFFIKADFVQIGWVYQFQFLELVAHQSQGEGCSENRHFDIFNQIW